MRYGPDVPVKWSHKSLLLTDHDTTPCTKPDTPSSADYKGRNIDLLTYLLFSFYRRNNTKSSTMVHYLIQYDSFQCIVGYPFF